MEHALLDENSRGVDGLLRDVELIDISDTSESKGRREDRSRDVDHFFGPPSTAANDKSRRECKVCLCVRLVSLPCNHSLFHYRKKKVHNNIVSDITTLRRHLQAFHTVRPALFLLRRTRQLRTCIDYRRHTTYGQRRTLSSRCFPKTQMRVESSLPSSRCKVRLLPTSGRSRRRRHQSSNTRTPFSVMRQLNGSLQRNRHAYLASLSLSILI